ncbi:MAG TPA: MFS transporter [Gaiellaceae bacterium]|nr:MFS transporter [Gaiellaceae bacterium]
MPRLRFAYATLGRQLFTESRRPAVIRESPRAGWYVVAAVCVGAFMGQLDASIVTLALPSLDTSFHTGVAAVEWVSLVYLLVLVATVAIVGHLADAVGRKLLYVYGFATFTVGSVLCGFAPALWVLIVFRAVQAIGAAMLQANSVALIAEAMPGRDLPRGIGVQGTAQALGLALGPAIGGALIAAGGWRLIFFVNAPVGLVGIVLAWFLLPRSRSLRPRSEGNDVRGAVLLATSVALTLGVLSLENRADSGWEAGVFVLVAAVVSTIAFVRHERRQAAPLIDFGMLRRRRLSVGLVSGLVSFLLLFGVLLVVPYYLAATGTGSLGAGLQLAMLPAAIAITAPLAGRRAARHRTSRFTASGLVVIGVGLAVIAIRHDTAGLLLGLAITGIGMGVFVPANNAGVMAAAPAQRTGVVSGILNMTRGLGTALGVAVASLLYIAAAGNSNGPLTALNLSAAEHGITLTAGVLSLIAVATSLLVLAAGDEGTS